MFSVFDGRYRDLTNFTSDECLHINSCGVSQSIFNGKARTTKIYRPDGRVDWHFLLVTNGAVTVSHNGKEHRLSVGDGFVYRPNDPQNYSFSVNEEEPVCKHLYVHFCGTSIDEIMEKAGLAGSAPLLNAARDTRRIFEALTRSHRGGDELTACGDLLRLISLFSPKSRMPKNDSEHLIRAQAEYISSHYTDEIDLNECAARCNLSRSRFTHLFTETVGTSPYRYQQQLRLEQAFELLNYSSLSVSEIAESVGFQDALYFSRLFRKYAGVSPSKYRSGK